MKIYLNGSLISEIKDTSDITFLAKEYAVKNEDFTIVYDKKELDDKRSAELNNFSINNIFLNKEVIKDMAVKHTTMQDNEKARWIDIDNKVVDLTKDELGALVKQGTDKVEAIYFKYRQLKDDLGA